MKTPLVYVLCALLITVPAGLHYGPAEGTTLTRVFSQDLHFEYDEMSVAMNGMEIPPEYLPDMTLDLDSHASVRVLDRLKSMADGRPRRLERTFGDLVATSSEFVEISPASGATSNATAQSPLSGLTVRFEWNEQEGALEPELLGDAEADVHGLVEDMDLRLFLPEDADVAPGDEWGVDVAAVAGLFHPGGDLGWNWTREKGVRAEDEEEEREVDWSGSLVAVMKSVVDGVAQVEFGGKCESKEQYAGNLDEVPVADGTTTTVEINRYVITGKLYWDVAAGHARALTAQADVEKVLETEKDPGQPGGSYGSVMVLRGTWDCLVSIDAE